MPQAPLGAFVAENPSNVLKPLRVDASGNLIVTSATGGDAVTVADGADVAEGTTTDTAWASGAGTVVAVLKAIAGKSSVPVGATQITSSSGNQANTNAVATLAAVAAKTTYITGFTCTAAGATAAAVVEVTVVGLIGGTATYIFTAPAGATVAATPLNVQFPEPVAASAVNTAIVVTLPALGAGNTNAAVVATGYQL